MGADKCPICGKSDCLLRDDPNNYKYISCKTFEYQFSVDQDIFEAPVRDRNKLLNQIFEFLCNTPFCLQGSTKYKWFFFDDSSCQKRDSPNYINIQEIPLNYPANFTEKMNRILLNLYHRWPDMDNSIYIDDTCGRLMFCESENTEQEAKRLMAHIISLGFVEGDVVLGYFQFTVQGWKKIEEMLRQPKISVLEDKIEAPINALVEEIPELQKHLVSKDSSFMPGIKTIYSDAQFVDWKSRVQYQLQQMTSSRYITEILELLDGFNGWHDEKDFIELSSKLKTLLVEIDKGIYTRSGGALMYRDKIFIVHGHNTDTRNNVELFLRRIGLSPIILSNEANLGRTVIEKFEDFSDVSYAIILYTACDEGKAKGATELKDRARQNVLFEHGYFCSKLGRDHVAALVEHGVEIPSDLNGIIFISLDEPDWKDKVKRELKATGIEADWTRD